MNKITVQNQGSAALVWIAGWLFTIGFLGLQFFWTGVLAILVWPLYLGQFIATLI